MKFRINKDKVPEPDKFRLSAPTKEGKDYTWETRVDVATRYMALGNMRLISETTKIPYITLQQWKKSDWWPDLIDEIKKTRQLDRVSKLSKLVDRSLELIEDRLENGDWIFDNKAGEAKRKPVSLRDASNVAKDLIDRQIQVEKVIEGVEHKQDTVQETLKLLAEEFKKWNRKQSTEEAETIDFKDIKDALHEEREEGLQAGG